MAIVGDSFKLKKLNSYNLIEETKFKSGNQIVIRKTNNTVNDDVENAIILEKKYYKGTQLLKKIYGFDSRITYSYVFNDIKDEICKCPNCGYTAKTEEFINGCSYCGTAYNINYSLQSLGGKEHYDRIIHSNKYRIITLIIDLLISFIVSFNYIYSTSRTFNIFDISKILVFTILIGLPLYYIFYLLDVYIVLYPIKVYKDKQNNKQRLFWEKMQQYGVIKDEFFNNFNYELNKYYFENDNNVIDYNIIDYLDFNYTDNKINVLVKIRIVKYVNNKIELEIIDRKFVFKQTEKVNELNAGVNIIKCYNCGSSINAEVGECDYCGTHINYLQKWYLEK